jgi:hypothetical protein
MIRFVGLILLLLGVLYIGLNPNNSSKILDNVGKSAVIALDPNNNGFSADEIALKLPKNWVELVDGKTYTAVESEWTLWTKKTGMCPGVIDTNGLHIVKNETEYMFRSRSGNREVTGFEIALGESLPGYSDIICTN